MPLFRTQGIVLRARDLGERDRLVTLFTRDLGKLTAVARGARGIRSRFGGGLELFTCGDAVGFEREGRELLRLDHFDIRHSFSRLREDLERLGQGARMVEALARLTAERDPHPACFALLLRALRALETGSPARVQLAFTLRLLDLTGHRPRLDRCVGCGRLVGTTAVAFDPDGGVVCGACRAPGQRPISPRALGVLRGLQAAGWEARLTARIASAVEGEAATVLDGYLAALSGSALRTPRFLAQTMAAAGLRGESDKSG
ncbi:MAG TPA: DNA repair protein RecO [Methylomirabilota bacterium]|jgi:DNA repair protein RecO (recombination protein O)|nr:DNA repair protein RecO [Methylomirabilota bacterium]